MGSILREGKMIVKLANQPDIAAMVKAAGVCRKSNKPNRALKEALKAGHDSLLEHMVFTFEIDEVSRALTHQLVRHRLASYAQESQRHCIIDITAEWYVTPKTATPFFHTLMQVIGSGYLKCLEDGMPAEDARYVLPNGAKTKLIVTMNARALDNFFKLRCCQHAQWEIRNLAFMMKAICEKQCDYFAESVYPDCDNCKDPCS
jgi:thymidylate synthase (FAD)